MWFCLWGLGYWLFVWAICRTRFSRKIKRWMIFWGHKVRCRLSFPKESKNTIRMWMWMKRVLWILLIRKILSLKVARWLMRMGFSGIWRFRRLISRSLSIWERATIIWRRVSVSLTVLRFLWVVRADVVCLQVTGVGTAILCCWRWVNCILMMWCMCITMGRRWRTRLSEDSTLVRRIGICWSLWKARICWQYCRAIRCILHLLEGFWLIAWGLMRILVRRVLMQAPIRKIRHNWTRKAIRHQRLLIMFCWCLQY